MRSFERKLRFDLHYWNNGSLPIAELVQAAWPWVDHLSGFADWTMAQINKLPKHHLISNVLKYASIDKSIRSHAGERNDKNFHYLSSVLNRHLLSKGPISVRLNRHFEFYKCELKQDVLYRVDCSPYMQANCVTQLIPTLGPVSMNVNFIPLS